MMKKNIKTISLILSIVLIFCLCACTKKEISEEEASYMGGSYPEPTAVAIYAPETSVLFLATVMEKFDAEHPEIIVSATYSDSVDNAEKIMSGYKCDIFVTDNPYLIDFDLLNVEKLYVNSFLGSGVAVPSKE